jgi:hypothetical protein
VGAVTAAVLAACGASDSTVAKTPERSVTVAPTPSAQALPPSTPSPTVAPAAPTAAAYDPCATNLGAPEIARAVASLPPDPRSGQGWNPGNPNTRALMFHQGKFIPTGVPDAFGFNGVESSASTGDTVALKFSNGLRLDSVVRYRWNGNNVELVANAAQ